ncbi:MAG TPA: hypothetical protein VGL53_30315 [Bryobacteraceae bacterium]
MSPTFSDQPVGTAVVPCPLQKKDKPVYWLQIELVGEDDKPIPWEEYKVILPDGTETDGYLDQDGFAGFEGIPQSGSCKISFPNLDKDAWEEVAVLPKKASQG